jgi:hypothetical protein
MAAPFYSRNRSGALGNFYGAFAENFDFLHSCGISENKFRPADRNGGKTDRRGVEKVISGSAERNFYNKNSNGASGEKNVIRNIRRKKKRN